MTDTRPSSTVVSLAIHAGFVALLLLASKQMMPPGRPDLSSAMPLIAPLLPREEASIKGGGGMHQDTPASAGHLPRIAPRQFVPPTTEIVNPHPKLAMEMTIEAPPEVAQLDRALPNLGDPLSRLTGTSGGIGGPLGIGDGRGTGVGRKSGPGAGDGDSANGRVYGPGSGAIKPVLLHSVDPEFSEEARKAKYQGTVMLQAEIDQNGHPRNIRVARSLGMGLDEKAMEAVAHWVFRPGTKDGKPVIVSAFIQVTFHLL